MKLCFFQHRDFKFARLVYMAGGEAEFEIRAPKKEIKEAVAPTLEFDFDVTNPDAVWRRIDDTYGRSAYRTLITDYVDSVMSESPDDFRAAIIKHSTTRYMLTYEQIRAKYMVNFMVLEAEFDETVEEIRDNTQAELDALKSSVEGAREMVYFKRPMPESTEHSEVKDYFDEYLDALNARYFNEDVDKGSKYHADYDDMSSDCKDKMKDWVEAKLSWLLKNKQANKGKLISFKNEIAARYKKFSLFDKNSAIISSVDLKRLYEAANRRDDAISQILTETDKETLNRLEMMHLLNPDAWNNAIEMKGNVVIQNAENNFSEKKFTAVMKRYRKNVKDFDDAKSEFWEVLEERSKLGASETLGFLQQFSNEVHGDVLKFEKDVDEQLQVQVSKQLDYLLGGYLVPERDTDQKLVLFMTGSRESRDEMLADRGTRTLLFLAIKQATTQYNERFEEIMPSGSGELKRKPIITKTTSSDKAARLKALIILAEQSKVIISKLSKTPKHKKIIAERRRRGGMSYLDEIKQVQLPEDIKAVRTGLKFVRSGSKHIGYQSKLGLGGFTTRGLGLKAAKVIGVLAVVSNVAQTWSEAEGEDLLDKLGNTLEEIPTNHGVLFGAAVTVGAHMAERNPMFLKYPWLSQHGRAGAFAAFKLDNLRVRLGTKTVDKFFANNAEWRALKDKKMSTDKIKELIKQANERTKRGQKPVITVDDMKEVFPPKDYASIASGLTSGDRSARMRYLFYSKFFSSQIKPDVEHVKQLCTKSSYIAEPLAKKKT